MHLLVVSHSCSTALNQQIYADIQKKTGWKITLVIPASWKDEFGNRLDEPPWSGLESCVVRCPVMVNGNIIFHTYLKRWESWLRELNPDVIYMNHEPYALATAQVCWANARSVRVPFGFYSCQNLVKKYPAPFSWLEKMVYQRSSFALPITRHVSDVLTEKGFRGQQSLCALPLDPELYHPRLRDCVPAGFPNNQGAVLGFVGRLTEVKGLKTLAYALGKIKEDAWHLVMVGTGDFQLEFERLLIAQGVRERVTFTGYVPHQETPRWLASMDVLILPSETQPNWKEQFGRVIPEALSCGAAVVGSSSGEIPFLIEQSGGGLVFAERDPDSLAEALRTMIREPELRRAYANQGRSWVQTNIALPAVTTRMIHAFESACAQR